MLPYRLWSYGTLLFSTAEKFRIIINEHEGKVIEASEIKRSTDTYRLVYEMEEFRDALQRQQIPHRVGEAIDLAGASKEHVAH